MLSSNFFSGQLQLKVEGSKEKALLCISITEARVESEDVCVCVWGDVLGL